MRQLTEPYKMAEKILGKQETDGCDLWRLTTHCLQSEEEEGVLFYNSLTGELLLLTREEAAMLKKLPGPLPEGTKYLAERWFLRPLQGDDMALAIHLREIVKQLAKRAAQKRSALTKYLIFTTTACNARCFYCFEAGMKKLSMTEETARAAGDYIAAHCGGKQVQLRWFGGEPTLNTRAIDIITARLRQKNVRFASTMVSNGYLLDAALARRAKEEWNMEWVQITLDGTEEIYNQRKAYVSVQGSPFRKVLDNIDLLLASDVEVCVRLNMDEENERDLYALCDQLEERFGGKQGFGIYVRAIIDDAQTRRSGRIEETQQALVRKVQALVDHIRRKGLGVKERLGSGVVTHSCRADNDSEATIAPDGGLGSCECKIEDGIWGSVFSEERNEEVLQKWKEQRPTEEICKTCWLFPRCVRLKKCWVHLEQCLPTERSDREIKTKRGILTIYDDWKRKQAEQ